MEEGGGGGRRGRKRARGGTKVNPQASVTGMWAVQSGGGRPQGCFNCRGVGGYLFVYVNRKMKNNGNIS